MSTDNHTQARKGQPAKSPSGFSWTWVGVLIPMAAVVALLILGSGGDDGDGTTTIADPGTEASMFVLPTTAGTSVSLADTLAEGDALLYFSMGVGCDGCFAQVPEVTDVLAERGIKLVTIMVQPADIVRSVAAEWGIDEPILIDEDRAVSQAYDMLGKNGHTDRPFHSIVLVRQDGTVALSKTYNTMFVSAADMMADIDQVS